MMPASAASRAAASGRRDPAPATAATGTPDLAALARRSGGQMAGTSERNGLPRNSVKRTPYGCWRMPRRIADDHDVNSGRRRDVLFPACNASGIVPDLR